MLRATMLLALGAAEEAHANVALVEVEGAAARKAAEEADRNEVTPSMKGPEDSAAKLAQARASEIEAELRGVSIGQGAAAEAAVSPPAAASKRKGAQTFGKPLVIGLSHKTATVEVREKLSIPEAQWNEAAAALVGYETVQEAAILSTCNRFEVPPAPSPHARLCVHASSSARAGPRRPPPLRPQTAPRHPGAG